MSRRAARPVVGLALLTAPLVAAPSACSVYDESLLDAPLADARPGEELPRSQPDVSQGGSSGSTGGGGSADTSGADPSPESSTTGPTDARESSNGTGGAAGGAGGAAGAIVDASRDRAVEASSVKDASSLGDVSVAPDSGMCAGMALRFDGSVAYATAKLLSADDFTMEAWIRTTSSRPGTAAYQGLGLLYADVGGTANDFGLSLTNQNAAFVVGNPDTTLFSSAIVTTGTWRHVAVTRRRTTGVMTVYVDGQASGEITAANTGSLLASPTLTIGANIVSSRYYIGDVDEVRFWNVVRTPTQIAATLHTRLVGNESGLEDYYRFDQASGASVMDLATTKATPNDAPITGAPLFVPSDAPIFCD